MVPSGTDAHFPMEGGRCWGTLGDKVDFHFDLMEQSRSMVAEKPDNTIVFTQ